MISNLKGLKGIKESTEGTKAEGRGRGGYHNFNNCVNQTCGIISLRLSCVREAIIKLRPSTLESFVKEIRKIERGMNEEKG